MFEIKSFCFDVVMCDIVPDVRAIHELCLLLPAPGILFGIMSDARATASCCFPAKNSYFRKDFQMLFAVKEGGMQTPNRVLGQI